jgi:LysM repeat protein
MDIRSLLGKLDSIQQEAEQGSGDATAKQKEYSRAQAQMDRLEKAAQYTGDDEIVRSRMGLPPKLPAVDQWDGKMPQPVGKPDWVAQLGSIGQAGQDQSDAVAANQDDNAADSMNKTATKAEKVLELQQLLDQLAAMAQGTTTATENIFNSLIREFKEQVLGEAIDPKAQELINQINVLTKDLGAISGDDQEVAKLVGTAQSAVKDFQTQSDQAAPVATTPVAMPVATSTDLKPLATPATAGSAYTIKAGDTLGKIAKDNGTTVDALMKANPQIKSANNIAAGAKLNLTGGTAGATPNQSDAETARLNRQAGAATSGDQGAKLKRFQELLAKMQKTTEEAVDDGMAELSSINEAPVGAALKGAFNYAKGAVAGLRGGSAASMASAGASGLGKAGEKGVQAAMGAKNAVSSAGQAIKNQVGNVAKVGAGVAAGAAGMAAMSGNAAPAAIGSGLSAEEKTELDALAKELGTAPAAAELMKQYADALKSSAQQPAASNENVVTSEDDEILNMIRSIRF